MSTEKFTVSGDQILAKVKQIIREGNVRHVRIMDKTGKVMLEIPLTVGVPAAALTIMMAPVLAAVGAFAALVAECTLEVDRVGQAEKK